MKEDSKALIPLVEFKLPSFTFDFEAIKGELLSELEKYNGVVVTAETLKDDKKLAQELSVKGKAFNKQRIDKIKEISKPIELFKSQMDELVLICNQTATKIKDQVSKFEDKRLEAGEKLAEMALHKMRDEAGIELEFQTSSIPQIKLGSLTAKDALTKGTLDKLKEIVSNELSVQQKVQFRLLQLESESYKAKLKTPLVRLNVEPFLFSSDENYTERLAEIIESELGRQDIIEQESSVLNDEEVVTSDSNLDDFINHRTEEYIDTYEYNMGVDLASGQDQSASHYIQESEPEPEYQQQECYQPEQGNVVVSVITTFKVEVPHQVSDELVANKIVEMIGNAGIESLDNVQVIRDA